MHALNKPVKDLRRNDMLIVAGHLAIVADIKFIDDWAAVSFKMRHSVVWSTMILPNELVIEVEIED